MHFADENRAHELVVSRAERCAIGVERDIRGQCVSLQRPGEHDGIERLLLIGDLRNRADPGIAEPTAGARGLAGTAADGGVERFDPRDVGLIPPPFHGPPADPGFGGHGQNALQLEQSAADRHVMSEPEADDLLQAVDLIVAAHEIDQNIRAKCRRIG